ncbi:MAG: C4-type zinc ribbon domain-containing protein [Campylobacterota bacterium]|nr:C4-type zinc ribbon domain-containing protein [Campylobacterota bacterium]
MNKDLEQLVKLSNFDKNIVSFEPKIENEQAKLKVFTKAVDKLNQTKEQIISSIEDHKNKLVLTNETLEELNNKISSIKEKHKIAKNEKEVKALIVEDEIAQEQIKTLNEDIDKLENAISTKTTELEEITKELEEEEESVCEIKENVTKNIKELEDSKDKLFEEKSILISIVDPKVLTFYEKIKRWAKETAVVPLKKQACYGCHMKLTDRFYSQFVVSSEIMTCPHCGRIIYKDDSEEA